jgi:hypothetical protein
MPGEKPKKYDVSISLDDGESSCFAGCSLMLLVAILVIIAAVITLVQLARHHVI